MDNLLVIFQPDDITRCLQLLNPIGGLFEGVQNQFPNTLRGQFRIFPYLIPETDYNERETGIIYTRGEKDNPLSRVSDYHWVDPDNRLDDNRLVGAINRIALDTGGIIEGDKYKFGRLRISNPSNDLYTKALMLGLEPQYHQFGLKPPDEVRRFILSLERGETQKTS